MKKSLSIISILGFGAAGAFANFPNPITTDTTDIIQMTDALVMGADNITVTHDYNGARHWVGSLDLKGYDGTKLVIHNVTGTPSSTYFGFNGVTFKNTGGSNTDTLKITNTGDNFRLMNGITVSNMLLRLNVGTTMDISASHSRNVVVKDNASLYWSDAANSTSRLNFVVGTEGSATDTNSFLNFGYKVQNWGYNASLIVHNGYFYMSDNGGRTNFSTAAIHALAADSFIQDIGVNAGSSFTVDAGIDHKIYTQNTNIVLFNTSTLTVNSEEVFYRGSLNNTKDSEGYVIASTINKTTNRVGLYFASTAGISANVVLGANNTFARIANNAEKSLNLTLNGNVFTVLENIDFSSFDLYIADFENDSVKISTTTEDWADHITAMYKGSALTDLEFRDGFLFSASAVVPEPAAFAALFGAIALGFAAYRRRK